jgi:intron-binding protein aquarius
MDSETGHESHVGYEILFLNQHENEDPVGSSKKRKAKTIENVCKTLKVKTTSLTTLSGTFGVSQPQSRRNKVRFTPTQIEAIKAGSCKGLCLIVGPPGMLLLI